jgi:ribose transport system substrate-binding protein
VLSGATVELPSVPRADKNGAVQGTLGKRAAAMGTCAVHREQLSIDVADSVAGVCVDGFDDLARRKLREGSHFHECHNMNNLNMQRSFLLVALAALTIACREEPKRVIGVVPKGANHIFWQTVHAGAVKAAREYHLEVEWNSPTLEIDASRQIAIVDSMINRHLAGIALAPVDRKALVSPVERAQRAGIPVAIFDSDIDTKERITYVATNNREGGRMAARQLAGLMLNRGKCALIGFMPGSASTMEREEGFLEEMKKYPDIQVVQTLYGMASQANAMKETENVLTRYPDLNGLFADNESSSMGAVAAITSRSESRVRVVAFDASERLVDDLRHRFIDALLVQDPFKMGYMSVKAIGMKLNGQTPEANVDSGLTVVTRADLEKPDIIPLLYPDIKKYLSPPR